MSNSNPTIEELEAFFAAATLPKSIQLSPGVNIIDVKGFVDVYLTRYKAYPQLPLYQVYYDKLLLLKNLLHSGK